MVAPHDDTPVPRPSARVLLIDDNGHTLLFCSKDEAGRIGVAGREGNSQERALPSAGAQWGGAAARAARRRFVCRNAFVLLPQSAMLHQWRMRFFVAS